ncbi:MAG TPA: hypothetical protein VGC77_20295 [Rhodopseudomonas sp.]|uniref:hypothetical protein n=1 Tax=Rhodopseudomonas sp. TaxID=1078 RepID=UPI002ED966B3
MSQSTRVVYTRVQGRLRANFNWPPISRKSAVLITAAEWGPGPPDPSLPLPGRPHLGEANVYVTNIGPHGDPGGEAGGVEFYVHADWPSPIKVVVTITVLGDCENQVVVEL